MDEAARLYLQSDPPLSIRQIAARLNVNQVTVSKALDQLVYGAGAGTPRWPRRP